MLLWVIFAVLTALVSVAILRPIWRQRPAEGIPARDVEIYKQQLQEVAAERASGLIAESEAQAAQIEISRRLIAATEAAATPKRRAAPAQATASVPYVMVGLLAALSAGLYIIYGSPDLPEQPFASRTMPQNPMQAFIERVERQLKTHPEDGAGWSVAGALYARAGRFAEAVDAHTKALKILGENGERLANLGEAMTLANNGVVIPEARAVFAKALVQDANDPRANFWLAMADEQAGKLAEAADRYKKLLAGDFPEDAKSILRKRLAAIEERLGTAQGGQGAQSGQATQNAAEAEVVDSMVSHLAERLKKDGTDLKGWLMLVRAYTVLGRKDDALKALNEARSKFTGNSDALGQIDTLAQSLGLAS